MCEVITSERDGSSRLGGFGSGWASLSRVEVRNEVRRWMSADHLVVGHVQVLIPTSRPRRRVRYPGWPKIGVVRTKCRCR